MAVRQFGPMEHPLLDPVALETRVAKAREWWFPFVGAAVTDGILFATGAIPLAFGPGLIVAVGSAVLAVAVVRQAEGWWARFHTVPLAMYGERLARYVEVQSERLTRIRDHAAKGHLLVWEQTDRFSVEAWELRAQKWIVEYAAIRDASPPSEQDVLIVVGWPMRMFPHTPTHHAMELCREIQAKAEALEMVRDYLKRQSDT